MNLPTSTIGRFLRVCSTCSLRGRRRIFRDQQLALTKIARVLTPSGQLVLTTINPFVYNRIRRTAQNPLKEGSIVVGYRERNCTINHFGEIAD